jgi:hypothetical protein
MNKNFSLLILLLLSACGAGGGSKDITKNSSSVEMVSSVAVFVSSSSSLSSITITSSSSIQSSTQVISSSQKSSQLSSAQSTSSLSSAKSSLRSSSRSSSIIMSSSSQSSVSSSSQSSNSSSVVSSSSSSINSSMGSGDYSVDCITGSGATLYVSADYMGTSNGSFAQPYKNVQAAVNAASSNSVINVATGTYNESVNINEKSVHLCGGWSSDFSVRNPELYPAILRSPGSTAVQLTTAKNTSIVGFTISDSKWGVFILANAWPATRADSNPLLAGNIIEYNGTVSTGGFSGGLALEGGFLTLTKNIIRNNKGSKGAALNLEGTSVLIQGNIVESNEGGGDHGGAIYSVVSDIYFYNNLIKGNEVGTVAGYGWGGGMIIIGRGDFKGNVWTDNYSASHGGGLFVDEDAQVTMSNDLFYNNRCSKEGGDSIALDMGSSRAQLTATNITVVENHMCGSESAILMETGADLILKNSIIWNGAGTIDIHFQESNSTVNISYSIYQTVSGAGSGGNVLTTGLGNSDSNPLFANPAIHDYHLQSIGGRYNPITDFWEIDVAHSPAIDAGDPASSYSEETLPNGGRINMGAYGNTLEASRSQ